MDAQPTTNSINLILRHSKVFTLCRINTTQRRLSSILEHCGLGVHRAINYWSTTFWVTIYMTRLPRLYKHLWNTYGTETERRKHRNTYDKRKWCAAYWFNGTAQDIGARLLNPHRYLFDWLTIRCLITRTQYILIDPPRYGSDLPLGFGSLLSPVKIACS